MILPRQDLDLILSHTGALWEQARGKTFFLTGATGFFGIWLLESLLHANRQFNLGITALVLTRNPRRFARNYPHIANDDGIGLVAGDIRTCSFPRKKISAIIHGATTSATETFHGQPSLLKFDTVALGTRRILDYALQSQAKSFLLISSGAVYGPQPNNRNGVSEKCLLAPDPLSPDAALGISKRVAEFFCGDFFREQGLNITIARCFSFLGPLLPLNLHYAAGNFLRDTLQHRDITIRGDGNAIRGYMYTADLAAWLWTILFAGQPGRVYNVGSDHAVTIRELAVITAQIVHPKSRVILLNQSAGTTSGRSCYLPDISRAKKELGLTVWTDLETAIRKTAAWIHDCSRMSATVPGCDVHCLQ